MRIRLLPALGFLLLPYTHAQTKEVTIHVVDRIPYKPELLGMTKCTGDRCTIWIRKESYPGCLLHEIRHVFEGKWHRAPSTAYCLPQEQKRFKGER